MGKQFADVNCSRGAPMGRPVYLGDRRAPYKFRIFRVRPCGGGDYDDGGAYWGDLWGSPLYCCVAPAVWDEERQTDWPEVREFVRARSRDYAKHHIKTYYPLAKFYR